MKCFHFAIVVVVINSACCCILFVIEVAKKVEFFIAITKIQTDNFICHTQRNVNKKPTHIIGFTKKISIISTDSRIGLSDSGNFYHPIFIKSLKPK